MGTLRRLAEEVRKVSGTDALRSSIAYQQSMAFLKYGVMPNGHGVRDGGPRPLIVVLGDVNACELQRLSRSARDDGSVEFDARFKVHPARGGGAGVSVDGAITDVFLAQAENIPGDASARFQLAVALYDVCREREDAIRDSFRGLFSSDGVWRIVGWAQREQWTVEDMQIANISFDKPVVDQYRGETWVARHWEAWVPVTLDVRAVMRRRG